MESQRVMNWIHVATGVGVLIGLLLVYAELQQAKQLAAAELISVGFSEGLNSQRVVMGEEFAEIYARACMRPRELTEADIVALDFYFQSQIITLVRLQYLKEIGGIGEAPDDVIAANLRPILATEIGRRWFEGVELSPRWQAVLETHGQGLDCGDYYRHLSGTSPH